MTTRSERWLPPWVQIAFWAVLALKVLASFFFASHYLRDLFEPFVGWFVDTSLHAGPADPWAAFVAAGHADAFPYSAPMLGLLAVPRFLATLLVPGLVHDSLEFRLFLLRVPMLAADVAVFAVLCRWFETRRTQVFWLYWCSPVLFYISYVHGQIDAIPSALLFLSLAALFRRRDLAAGLLLGLGIGTKAHLLVALPLLLVYLFRNAVRDPRRGRRIAAFLAGSVGAAALSIGPALGSDGYRTMVLGTAEAGRLFDVAVPLTGHLFLYVGPAALLVLFLRFASTPKVNRDLAILFLALVFGVLVLLLPPMPGWYFWSLPLIAYFYIRQEAISAFTYWLVSGLYLVYYGLFWTDPAGGQPLVSSLPGVPARADVESLVFTALQASLAMAVYWIYRVGIQSNREYGLRERPLLVGIGGDSGAGKHTLAAVLRDLVDPGDWSQTEGDDYHRFERGDEAWKTLTHLDPRANYMFRPVEHLWALKRGRAVEKPVYDHATGTMSGTTVVRPAPFVCFVGLHPFYLRRMRNLLDLKLFVEPDEGLRRLWKTRRDQAARGYDGAAVREQIERREPDSRAHVRPQRQFADWVVAARPAAPMGEDAAADLPLRIRHVLRNDLPLEDLVAGLSGVPGLDVSWELDADMERQALEVAGTASARDLKTVALRLFPNLPELLGTEDSTWHDGLAGVSQLVFAALLHDRAAGG